ncbi:hypothetical protein AOLI_G00126550 [Acnodon oligacanthus]
MLARSATSPLTRIQSLYLLVAALCLVTTRKGEVLAIGSSAHFYSDPPEPSAALQGGVKPSQADHPVLPLKHHQHTGYDLTLSPLCGLPDVRSDVILFGVAFPPPLLRILQVAPIDVSSLISFTGLLGATVLRGPPVASRGWCPHRGAEGLRGPGGADRGES